MTAPADATDRDRDRLQPLALAAIGAIDQRLQLRPLPGGRAVYSRGGFDVVTYLDGEQPPDVVNAAVQLTTELFRRPDAPFGVLNTSSPTGEPVRVSRDQLAGVETLLAPYVEGWGFA